MKLEPQHGLFENLLNSACYGKNIKCVKYVHEIIRISCNEWTIVIAAKSGNIKIVKYLYSINRKCQNSVQLTGIHGQMKVVKYLNSIKKICPSHMIEEINHDEIVKYLRDINKTYTYVTKYYI
jgi:hypothetical protein